MMQRTFFPFIDGGSSLTAFTYLLFLLLFTTLRFGVEGHKAGWDDVQHCATLVSWKIGFRTPRLLVLSSQHYAKVEGRDWRSNKRNRRATGTFIRSPGCPLT
eukprot:1158241-Pelagomonas_calceolata.AAC.9